MPNHHYILSYEGHECYVPVILRGPYQEDWNAFVAGLVDEAANRALDKGDWLGWFDSHVFHMSLIEVLEEAGYAVVIFPETKYREVIADGNWKDPNCRPWPVSEDTVERIIESNEALNERIQKRQKSEKWLD